MKKYSGAGSITKFGPGLSDKTFSELNNDYDFSYEPMGYADAISKEHDLTQENTIDQPQGWLEDTRTLASDMVLLYKARRAIKNNGGNSVEDADRLLKISNFFSHIYRYKTWKIGEMKRRNLDINRKEDQLKVIFSDWKPKFFSADWFSKLLLDSSGGGAKENERGTVKPKTKK